jgi:hypothetical protein
VNYFCYGKLPFEGIQLAKTKDITKKSALLHRIFDKPTFRRTVEKELYDMLIQKQSPHYATLLHHYPRLN